jgi:hypothetical protein
MTPVKLTRRSLRDELEYLLATANRDTLLPLLEVAVLTRCRDAQLAMRDRCAQVTDLDPNYDAGWHHAGGMIEERIRALEPTVERDYHEGEGRKTPAER